MRRLLIEIENDESVVDFLKSVDMKVADLIAESWDEIEASTIQKSWRKITTSSVQQPDQDRKNPMVGFVLDSHNQGQHKQSGWSGFGWTNIFEKCRPVLSK